MSPLLSLGPHVVPGDVARFLVVILGSLDLAVAAVVVVRYTQAYLLHRRLRHAGREEKWKGLLPRHVVLLGISYFGIVLVTVIATVQNLHGPLRPRLWVYIIAYAAGLWAMRDVLMHSQHRLHNLRTGMH